MNEPLNRSFRNVATLQEAEEICAELALHSISTKISKDGGDLDYVLQGEAPTNKFEIYIKEADINKAEQLLIELASKDIEAVDSDYYLFSFTNDELMDVLIKKNEWNELDVALSRKILNERGVEIDNAQIIAKQEEREQELEKPEGGQVAWIVVGYLSALFGGFLGLIIGYFIWQAKNKLPNGKKVPAYSDSVRKHGLIIFVISAIVFPTVLILRVAGEVLVFSKW